MTEASSGPRALVIMRHGKSDWDRAELEDFQRPLSRKGRQDARRAGRVLGALGLTPDAIVASPATRTRDTARIVARRTGFRAPIAWEQGLYGAEAQAYLSFLRGLDPAVSTVLVVGHNPALEQLVATLAGALVRLPTGATLLLRPGTELDPLERWSDLGPGTCTLEWLITPRLVRRLR